MDQARTRKAKAHHLKRCFTCHTLETDPRQTLDFRGEEQYTDWSLSTYSFCYHLGQEGGSYGRPEESHDFVRESFGNMPLRQTL